jgi:hypothetical protein
MSKSEKHPVVAELPADSNLQYPRHRTSVRLTKTQALMRKLSGDPNLRHGQHVTTELIPGSDSVQVGEVDFDEMIHDPLDIDHFSMMGIALGVPQVPIIRNRGALAIKLFEDRSLSGDDPEVKLGRENLVEILRNTLVKSRASNADPFINYVIDDFNGERKPNLGRATKPIDSSLGADYVTEKISMYSKGGISFIISNFEGLELPVTKKSSFSNIVAIKANIFPELEMIANTGIWAIGNGEYVDSNNPIELSRFNKDLDSYHETVRESLRNLGMAVTQIVFDSSFEYGFNVDSVDNGISNAVREIKII